MKKIALIAALTLFLLAGCGVRGTALRLDRAQWTEAIERLTDLDSCHIAVEYAVYDVTPERLKEDKKSREDIPAYPLISALETEVRYAKSYYGGGARAIVSTMFSVGEAEEDSGSAGVGYQNTSYYEEDGELYQIIEGKNNTGGALDLDGNSPADAMMDYLETRNAIDDLTIGGKRVADAFSEFRFRGGTFTATAPLSYSGGLYAVETETAAVTAKFRHYVFDAPEHVLGADTDVTHPVLAPSTEPPERMSEWVGRARFEAYFFADTDGVMRGYGLTIRYEWDEFTEFEAYPEDREDYIMLVRGFYEDGDANKYHAIPRLNEDE